MDDLKQKFDAIWERYEHYEKYPLGGFHYVYRVDRDAMWEEILREILLEEDGK